MDKFGPVVVLSDFAAGPLQILRASDRFPVWYIDTSINTFVFGGVYADIPDSHTGPTTNCFSFASDPNTGIFHPGPGIIGFSAGAAERMRLTMTELDVSVPVTTASGSGLDLHLGADSGQVTVDASYLAIGNTFLSDGSLESDTLDLTLTAPNAVIINAPSLHPNAANTTDLGAVPFREFRDGHFVGVVYTPSIATPTGSGQDVTVSPDSGQFHSTAGQNTLDGFVTGYEFNTSATKYGSDYINNFSTLTFTGTTLQLNVSAFQPSGSNTTDIGGASNTFRKLYITDSITDGASNTASMTEVGYLSGVTSSIQTQLNTITNLQGFPVDATTPTAGQALVYTGSTWSPLSIADTTSNVVITHVNGTQTGYADLASACAAAATGDHVFVRASSPNVLSADITVGAWTLEFALSYGGPDASAGHTLILGADSRTINVTWVINGGTAVRFSGDRGYHTGLTVYNPFGGGTTTNAFVVDAGIKETTAFCMFKSLVGSTATNYLVAASPEDVNNYVVVETELDGVHQIPPTGAPTEITGDYTDSFTSTFTSHWRMTRSAHAVTFLFGSTTGTGPGGAGNYAWYQLIPAGYRPAEAIVTQAVMTVAGVPQLLGLVITPDGSFIFYNSLADVYSGFPTPMPSGATNKIEACGFAWEVP